jgi:nucleoside-diphosphate-sugar epimerase
MNVLVLGGTGSIGRPVVIELVGSGHRVYALARSDTSARRLASFGATPIRGDIALPESWAGSLPALDGLVHVAATFDEAEERVQTGLLDALLPALARAPAPVRLVYTGGCWLYGADRGAVVTEESPFAAPAEFAWGVDHVERVLAAPGIHAVVIHPAMVYEASGGVFSRFCSDARDRDTVRVVGSEDVRWPLVHSEDLAVLYRLALERAPARESYLGVTLEGVPVGTIARAFARKFRLARIDPSIVAIEEIVAELGPWARGYALDQRQSGAKARRALGWDPRHVDPIREIESIDSSLQVTAPGGR